MDRKKSITRGVAISLLLIATPFVFYLYKYAPSDTKEWDTIFGVIQSGEFNSVQAYLHALVTKITFVLLTTIWYLTSINWWKHAILVPFTMFLFQLSGVINFRMQYIDEYDFWYSLPFIIPILVFLIYISARVSKKDTTTSRALKNDVDREIKNILSDEL